jgi:hypothetical protein
MLKKLQLFNISHTTPFFSLFNPIFPRFSSCFFGIGIANNEVVDIILTKSDPMNAQNIQKVGLWTALAGAVAALVVIATTTKRKITISALEKKYDDIFGV